MNREINEFDLNTYKIGTYHHRKDFIDLLSIKNR